MRWRNPRPWFALTVLAVGVVCFVAATYLVFQTINDLRSACQ